MLTETQQGGIKTGLRTFFSVIFKELKPEEILDILQEAYDNKLANVEAYKIYIDKNESWLRKLSDKLIHEKKYPIIWKHTLNGFFNADFDVLNNLHVLNSNRDTQMVYPNDLSEAQLTSFPRELTKKFWPGYDDWLISVFLKKPSVPYSDDIIRNIKEFVTFIVVRLIIRENKILNELINRFEKNSDFIFLGKQFSAFQEDLLRLLQIHQQYNKTDASMICRLQVLCEKQEKIDIFYKPNPYVADYLSSIFKEAEPAPKEEKLDLGCPDELPEQITNAPINLASLSLETSAANNILMSKK